jgi:zinc protease
MSRRILAVLLVGLWIAAAPLPRAEDLQSRGAKTIARLASVPLAWKLPEEGKDYQVVKHASGVTFYLKSDPTIPLLRVQCCVRAGAVFEQGYKPQVARVTARMLRECGSEIMTVEKMDSLLGYYSGELTIDCGQDFVWIDSSILSRHSSTLVEILAGILGRPAFTKEKLDFVERRIALEETSAAEDPFHLAARTFYQLLYPEHPYGYLYCADGVDKILLEDVSRYFQERYFPANAAVVVTGDFKAGDLLEKWGEFYRPTAPNREAPVPPVPEAKYRPGVYLLHKNINQSSIYFGLQAGTKDSPDLHRVHLLNHMVGGSSFASRFTQQVRDREGLAYRVDSLFDTDVLGRSAFIARCRTKTESTVRATDAMLWILGLFRDGKIPEGEFESGRSGLENGFVKRFATVGDLLKNFLMLNLLDRPRSYLADYQARVRAITPGELQETARLYLDPAKMTFVFVGNVRPLEDELKKFGPVYHLGEPEAKPKD